MDTANEIRNTNGDDAGGGRLDADADTQANGIEDEWDNYDADADEETWRTEDGGIFGDTGGPTRGRRDID